jgi:curli biogenesis system outer membrane secretion channel CsgG
MTKKRSAFSLAVAVAAAILVAFPFVASAQRRQAGAKNEKTTPQSEMKKGGKPRVFIAASANTSESWTNDVTRQALEEALVNSGRFEVIAGTQRDNLLQEQGFSNSDLVDPAQNAKVGRMLAAKYVISGTCQSVTTEKKRSGLGGMGGRILGGRVGSAADSASDKEKQKITVKIQIQMTDLEKGTILLTKSYQKNTSETSGTFESRSTDNPQEAAYRNIVADVAQQFVGELGGAVPIEALVASIANDGRVILNAGSEAGVQQGMRFEVYSEDEPIKDPSTGEVLDYNTTKYAVIRVNEVKPRVAYAEIVKTFDGGAADPAPVASRIEKEMSVRSMVGGGAPDGAEVQTGGKKKKEN